MNNVRSIFTFVCFLLFGANVFAGMLDPIYTGDEDLVNLAFEFSTNDNPLDISDSNPFGAATADISVGSGSSSLGWYDETFSFMGDDYTGYWSFNENISLNADYGYGETADLLVFVRVVYFQIGYQNYDEKGLENPVVQQPGVSVAGGSLVENSDNCFVLPELPNSNDAWILSQSLWEVSAGGSAVDVLVTAGDDGSIVDQVLICVVPEPATFVLLVGGLVLLGRKRWR